MEVFVYKTAQRSAAVMNIRRSKISSANFDAGQFVENFKVQEVFVFQQKQWHSMREANNQLLALLIGQHTKMLGRDWFRVDAKQT